LTCAWDCATANVHDAHFHPLIAQFDEQMIVLTDTGFHAKTGDPANLKICPRGTWNTRMLIETVLSMLTTVFHSKKVGHRVWTYFRREGRFDTITAVAITQADSEGQPTIPAHPETEEHLWEVVAAILLCPYAGGEPPDSVARPHTPRRA
jgi:hypothetical protein